MSHKYDIPVYEIKLEVRGTIASNPNTIEPHEVAKIVHDYIGPTDREHLIVLLVSNGGKLIGVNTVSIGTLSAAMVHPREVFKPAILASAARIILAHNHVGSTKPSTEDDLVTRQIALAGDALQIKLLDHIIVDTLSGQYYSYHEQGTL